MHAPGLLQDFLDAVMRITGARHVTALLTMAPLDRHTLLLAGRGDGVAIPELQDETTAWDFVSRHEIDHDADRRVICMPSKARGGALVRIGFDHLLAQPYSQRRAVGERRREPDVDTGPLYDGAIWIGLDQAAHAQQLVDHFRGDASLPLDSDAGMLVQTCFGLVWSVYYLSNLLNDPVSQLPGRMDLQISLKRGLAAVRRNEQAIGLMLVSPDDFTTINVRYGRRQGDLGVRQMAEALERCLRRTDRVFHYGGAVFAAVLPATDMAQSRLAAEKVRRALSSVRYVDNTVALTFSIGIAVATPRDIAGNASVASQLSQRADAALNSARLSGGARTVITDISGGDETGRSLVNPLSGIFAADTEKDYRNMLLLWETVALISTHTVPEDIASAFVDRLATGFRPDRVALYTVDEGRFETMASNVRDELASDGRASGRLFSLDPAQEKLVGETLETGRVARTRGESATETGFCAYAVPLIVEDKWLGCIYMDATGHRLDLDSSDVIFLNALAAQMAAAMDRAALSSRWIREKDRESRKLRDEVRELRQALHYTKMVYRSSAMQTAMDTLRKVAPSDATVLITGESGAGKEMLAQSLHELSDRREGPFVVFDCGAVTPSLLEAELFGHAQGAFTGAERASLGVIAQADGGTLFLDEVGRLPLGLQAKLLRFVQEKQLSSVGSAETRRANVRIVAATNRRLKDQVDAGRFRSDLYYRLRLICVHAVPLRDRTDDILPLAQYFLGKFAAQYGAPTLSLSAAAQRKLVDYRWPGNVRELEHCVLRAVLTRESDQLDAADIELFPEAPVVALPAAARRCIATGPVSVPTRLPPADSTVANPAPEAADPWHELCRELERQVADAFKHDHRRPVPIGRWLNEDLVLAADQRCNRVARQAARLIGLPESTFRRQLDKARSGLSNGSRARPESWASVEPLIGRVVELAQRSPIKHTRLLDRARNELLDCVHHTTAARPAAGASLMGVTPPTYKRWLRGRTKQ